MILRDYQIRTLDAVWAAMQVQKNTLMVAPCGSGKTILFSKLAQRLLREHPNFRVLILVDREILVRQFAEKLAKVAPELALSIRHRLFRGAVYKRARPAGYRCQPANTGKTDPEFSAGTALHL